MAGRRGRGRLGVRGTWGGGVGSRRAAFLEGCEGLSSWAPGQYLLYPIPRATVGRRNDLLFIYKIKIIRKATS